MNHRLRKHLLAASRVFSFTSSHSFLNSMTCIAKRQLALELPRLLWSSHAAAANCHLVMSWMSHAVNGGNSSGITGRFLEKPKIPGILHLTSCL